ncbi:hypothetical protein [Methylobacterium bullatum]
MRTGEGASTGRAIKLNGRIEQYHRIVTCYHKEMASYLGMIIF